MRLKLLFLAAISLLLIVNLSSLNASEKQDSNSVSEIAGGVVPHHLLAGYIITDFFQRLSAQKPETLILVGPNHKEAGRYEVLTSLRMWETPSGWVEPDVDVINALVKVNLAQIDDTVLAGEHSIGTIASFIRAHLPDTKIVPLALSSKLTVEDADKLATALASLPEDKAIIVASVDFSHYLTGQEAQRRDVITFKAITSHNYQKIYRLNNDYLDSPPSLIVLLMAMEKLGKNNFKILYHTNSGEILRDNSILTTSYFSIVYY